MVGLRADQSANRQDTDVVTQDFTKAKSVPVNALHVSIGCAPCTRAIAPGEPERAGRWWWEDESKKECGLHIGRAGRNGA